MNARARGLVGEERAAAAVELALLLPAFLILILGAFEMTLVMFVSGTVESAVLAASRYGVTGESVGGASREDHIRALIAERTMGFVDMTRITIATSVYPSFSAIGTPETFDDRNGNGVRDPGEPFVDNNGNGGWDQDMGKPGVGAAGDVVLYHVTYETRSISTLMRPLLGTIRHEAVAALRNEPYD